MAKKAQKSLPETPEVHAEGAVIPPEKVEIARLGLDNEPEMVIPLSESPKKLEEVAEKVAEKHEMAEDDGEKLKKALDNPSGVLAEPEKGDVRAELKRIFSTRKGKRDVPTLIWFHSDYAKDRRAVIVDINRNLMAEAWQTYRTMTGEMDAEVFLATVYDICKHDIPRMYRSIGVLDLS